jgi:hypothetical protein
MAQVLQAKTAGILSRGIRQRDAEHLASEIIELSDGDREAAIREELESSRERQQELQQQIDRLRRQIARSEHAVGLSADKLRQAVSTSLHLNKAPIIRPEGGAALDRPATYRFPADAAALAGDPSWAPALDLLREPRERGESVADWRLRAKFRPITFDDPGELADQAVQLHLEHRVIQRLLARFTSQGLLHLDLNRCCLASATGGDVRAILLGRLSLFGPRAARLHEEIVAVTARWSAPSIRGSALRPYGVAGEERTLELLEEALATPNRPVAAENKSRLLTALPQDVVELRPYIEERAAEARSRAELLLAERAARESMEMRELLQDQRRRIEQTARQAPDLRQLQLGFSEPERRQLEDDRRAWQRRLSRLGTELDTEPRRIVESYEVRAARLDPVGIVYLWPVTG